MDKYGLIDKIKHLDGLTDDEKSALLGLLRSHKKYGLVWEDKPEAVEDELKEKLPVLTEVKDKAIVNDTDTDHYPNHILIEGDNLHALTVLSYTHSNSIDVIYIDPPYNTGNKDFIYNDKFVDNEDSYRHSKWLSFLNKRLKIAKKLLSDKGIIFISIDDNEQANLKLLCDEIFGENNFVGTYFWKRTSTPPALSYKIRRKLEFVLCYQKSPIPKRTFAQGYVDGGDAPLLNAGNPIGTLKFPTGTVHFSLNDGTYTARNTYKIKLLNPVNVVNGLNANDFYAEGNFKWGQDNLNREVSNGTYFLIKSKQFSPRFQKTSKATKVPSNIIDEDVNVGTNEDAQKEIAGFNLDVSFDYAKPTSLVSYLCKMPFWNDNSITVLDFFAGSGTTLDATMKLNAEDGGHRQCILVTNNENGICENVTYIRNKKVIEGYTTPKGEQVAGLTHNNLRYYKTDFVPRDRTVKNMRDLVNAATDMLCIKENMYKEQTLFGPWDELPSFIARHFVDGEGGEMIIIYDETQIREIAKAIKGMKFEKPLKVYVFSTDRDPYEDEFNDVLDKVELCALPAAIYDAYVQVIPRPQDKNVEIVVNSNEEDMDSWDDGVQMEMDLAAEEDHR